MGDFYTILKDIFRWLRPPYSLKITRSIVPDDPKNHRNDVIQLNIKNKGPESARIISIFCSKAIGSWSVHKNGISVQLPVLIEKTDIVQAHKSVAIGQSVKILNQDIVIKDHNEKVYTPR